MSRAGGRKAKTGPLRRAAGDACCWWLAPNGGRVEFGFLLGVKVERTDSYVAHRPGAGRPPRFFLAFCGRSVVSFPPGGSGPQPHKYELPRSCHPQSGRIAMPAPNACAPPVTGSILEPKWLWTRSAVLRAVRLNPSTGTSTTTTATTTTPAAATAYYYYWYC